MPSKSFVILGILLGSIVVGVAALRFAFVQPIISQPGILPPSQIKDGCMVGGCSSQLCVDEKDIDGAISTCEYKTEYACYKTALCERQVNGTCGWTQTQTLIQCLNNARQ